MSRYRVTYHQAHPSGLLVGGTDDSSRLDQAYANARGWILFAADGVERSAVIVDQVTGETTAVDHNLNATVRKTAELQGALF